MNYVLKIENLDCANCASKVESAVKKLAEIKECAISFFTLKMRLETEGEMTDELMARIKKAAKKIEPDIKLSI